jgi:hypothetical protein
MRQYTDVYGFAVDADGQGARLDYTDTTTHHPGTIHVSAGQMHALVAEMDAKTVTTTTQEGT